MRLNVLKKTMNVYKCNKSLFSIEFTIFKIFLNLIKYNFFRFDTHRLYRKSVNKVVLMIIDGVRYDFFTEPEYNIHMPFSTDLVQQNRSCLFRTKVKVPTVTMPRIKVQLYY